MSEDIKGEDTNTNKYTHTKITSAIDTQGLAHIGAWNSEVGGKAM